MSSTYSVGSGLEDLRMLVDTAIDYFAKDDYEHALMAMRDIAEDTWRIETALREHLGAAL